MTSHSTRVLEEELKLLGYRGDFSLDELFDACEAIAWVGSLVHIEKEKPFKWAARAVGGAYGYGQTRKEAVARLLRELLLKKK